MQNPLTIYNSLFIDRKVCLKTYKYICLKIASETVSSIKTVQGLAQELMFVSQYEDSLEDPFKAAKKQAFSFAVMYAISQAVIYGMYSVAFRYGAYLVEVGEMSATDIYR